jgi:hypothetical protein
MSDVQRGWNTTSRELTLWTACAALRTETGEILYRYIKYF